MLYQPIKTHSILLETNETREMDAGSGLLLIPEDNSKVFLHWLNGDKLRATYTMTKATKVETLVIMMDRAKTPLLK